MVMMMMVWFCFLFVTVCLTVAWRWWLALSLFGWFLDKIFIEVTTTTTTTTMMMTDALPVARFDLWSLGGAFFLV